MSVMIPGNEKSIFAFVKGVNLAEGKYTFIAEGESLDYFDHSPIEKQISVPLVNINNRTMRITEVIRVTDGQFSQAFDILCAIKHNLSAQKAKREKAETEIVEINWPESWELEEFEGTWGLSWISGIYSNR